MCAPKPGQVIFLDDNGCCVKCGTKYFCEPIPYTPFLKAYYRKNRLMSKPDYIALGASIGTVVQTKQKLYGDSFGATPAILEHLYPGGIPMDQYKNALAIVRILDKLKRIATGNDKDGENPWEDIAGYAILMVARK